MRHLVIMSKAPVAGAAKSRLARGIGAPAAARLARVMTAYIVRALTNDPRWRSVLAVTPDHGAAGRRGWPIVWPPHLPRIAQGRGDLGRRLSRLLEGLQPGPVVVIGTDCPDIAPAHVAGAFRALGSHDAVIGPARDGGYWLIGLKRTPRRPRLFTAVRWSGPHALEDTLRSFPRDWRIARLETLTDIDTADDLAQRTGGRRIT